MKTIVPRTTMMRSNERNWFSKEEGKKKRKEKKRKEIKNGRGRGRGRSLLLQISCLNLSCYFQTDQEVTSKTEKKIIIIQFTRFFSQFLFRLIPKYTGFLFFYVPVLPGIIFLSQDLYAHVG